MTIASTHLYILISDSHNQCAYTEYSIGESAVIFAVVVDHEAIGRSLNDLIFRIKEKPI